MSKRRLHKAISAMISVQETGFGLPIPKRSYAVKLRTKGSDMTLLSYSVSSVDCNGKLRKPNATGARSAARCARKYFVDEITDRIHNLMEQP